MSLAAILLFLAILLFGWSNYSLHRAGLPSSQVIYADTDQWKPAEKVLFDTRLNLSGKPDYLVMWRGKVIPVEVKSNRRALVPYPSHLIQLMAYCYLVERTYGNRPPFGILHYPHRTFKIPYSKSQAIRLVALLDEMRSQEVKNNVPRSHQLKEKCIHCGYQGICEDRLL